LQAVHTSSAFVGVKVYQQSHVNKKRLKAKPVLTKFIPLVFITHTQTPAPPVLLFVHLNIKGRKKHVNYMITIGHFLTVINTSLAVSYMELGQLSQFGLVSR
jgi:hypothetical protein